MKILVGYNMESATHKLNKYEADMYILFNTPLNWHTLSHNVIKCNCTQFNRVWKGMNHFWSFLAHFNSKVEMLQHMKVLSVLVSLEIVQGANSSCNLTSTFFQICQGSENYIKGFPSTFPEKPAEVIPTRMCWSPCL